MKLLIRLGQLIDTLGGVVDGFSYLVMAIGALCYLFLSANKLGAKLP